MSNSNDIFHKNRDQFLEYLKKEQGYSKAETEEVDSYMRDNFGDAWNKQEIRTKPVKVSAWKQFKNWLKEKLAYIFTRRKVKTQTEAYKVETVEKSFRLSKSAKTNLLLLIGGALAVVVVWQMINKNKRR